PLGHETSPIVPLVLGEDAAALHAAAALAEAGFDVRAIRPPTVPEGSARLRLTVHAGQAAERFTVLAQALAAAVREAPVAR
ncbi:MAG TPA: hypothetical protein VFP94_10365, partial [Terriglobales bacterium]|nr:hypothetical protein [Terriglobales bacterium]